MKITDVKVFVSNQDVVQETAMDERGKGQTWDVVTVKIETDEGIEGISFAWGARSGKVTADIIHELIRPAILGEDPMQREWIWQKLRTVDRWHALLPIYALGPIDIALWDIAGKYAKLPILHLLGGYRTKVPAYASSLVLPSPDHYIEEAIKAKERGYRGYKLHPIGDPKIDVKTCAAVRAAVGNEMDLMLDPVGIYNYEQALFVGRALEELGYLWFEEPLPDDQMENYKRLSDKLDIPIAACESLGASVFGSSAYITQRACDIIRSDVSWKAGITGLRKTAAVCEAVGMNCEIHTTCYALLDAANLHVAGAIKNCTYHEVLLPEKQFTFGVKNPIEIDREGYVHVPSQPGLGLEIDWELLERTKIYEPEKYRF
jgi:L-alanine-DL-glutamate epimerase-like enolase superfamily enzyme